MHFHHDVSMKQADDGSFIVSCEDNSEMEEGGESEKKLYTAPNLKGAMKHIETYFSEVEKEGDNKKFKKGMKMAEIGG